MRALALLLLLAAPMIAFAQTPAEPPIIRTTLDPTDGIVIGQPVQLHIAVLFPGEMPHPPLVSVPEAAGAQILRFETQAVTVRDRIDGRDYVGQSFEFVVFPRRGGEVAVPAPAVTLLTRGGDPAGSAAGTAMRFSVSVPPGIDPSGPVLVADSVSVSESWSPEPDGRRFRTGDAVIRTIRRQAAGVPALGMTEFRFEAPEGVRVYIDPPVIEERSNRGSIEGQRTDKVTYVFERPGTFALPAVSQPWWSLADKTATTETLPGLTVTIEAAAQPTRTGGATVWQPALGGMTLILIALLTLVLLRERLRAVWRRAAIGFRSSEWFARRQLSRAARGGELATSYRAFATWRGRLSPVDREALRSDQRVAPCLAEFERAAFGGGGWNRRSGRELARAVSAWRYGTRSHRSADSPLPPLNPAA